MDWRELERRVADDPVGTIVSLAVAGATSGPRRTVEVRGRTIALPAWTYAEWTWWGELARRIAVRAGLAGARLFRGHAVRHEAMRAGQRDALPPADELARYYDATVRLAIESRARLSAPTRSQIVRDAIAESINELPATIRSALGAIVSAGGDAMTAVARETRRVVTTLFGVSPLALLAIGAALWWIARKSEKGGV